MKPAARFALLLVVLAGGCKKKGGPSLAVEWRDAVCQCKDMACVAKVSDDLAKRSGSTKGDEEGDPEAIAAAQKCIQWLESHGSAPAPTGLPAVPPKRDVDALVNAARAWQPNPRVIIERIEIMYVDANGLLDDEYGQVRITFGASNRPADDPKRKTGAPVKADDTAPTSCPLLAFNHEWSVGFNPCNDTPPTLPKCAVTQVWKRAVEQRAPADALAVINYRNGEQPSWLFTIQDAPRNVNIAHDFPDDCERILEKTQ